MVASKKPYKLIPVRFVEEGGTKMGHTVIMNWEAKVRGRNRHLWTSASTTVALMKSPARCFIFC